MNETMTPEIRGLLDRAMRLAAARVATMGGDEPRTLHVSRVFHGTDGHDPRVIATVTWGNGYEFCIARVTPERLVPDRFWSDLTDAERRDIMATVARFHYQYEDDDTDQSCTSALYGVQDFLHAVDGLSPVEADLLNDVEKTVDLADEEEPDDGEPDDEDVEATALERLSVDAKNRVAEDMVGLIAGVVAEKHRISDADVARIADAVAARLTQPAKVATFQVHVAEPSPLPGL